MVSTEIILLIANSNTLELLGLRNNITGSYINTATVAASLETLRGVSVQAEPIVLTYVADSDGCYRALLDADISIENNTRYKLTMTAQGEGLKATWEDYIQAKIRT